MSRTLNEMFSDVILQNELSGNQAAALRFSHAEGGTSGWSFGRCQFDVKNNDTALHCLAECGFTHNEIQGLVHETLTFTQVRAFSPRLVAAAAIIEKYDEQQLSYCLDKALNFDSDYGIPVESPGGILAGGDYCNQYGSEGNGAKAYYRALGRPVTAEDVLAFKLTTAYGKAHPGDCHRRYDGIMKVIKGD